MVILGYRPVPLLKKTFKETLEDNVLGIASQVAYNFFFSLFPLLLFLAPMLSLLGDKRTIVTDLLGRFSEFMPAAAFTLFSQVVTDIVFAQNAPGLISLGFVLALWSGSNIFTAFMGALNTAYDVKDARPWWKQRLIAIAVMVGWAVIITLVTGIVLAGDNVVGFLRNRLSMGSAALDLWSWLQFPLAIALLVAFLYLMYWALPYVKQDKRQILVGSVFAAVLFLVATLVFRVYVQHYPPNKTYGTIGAVMVLLTWMYVISVVILVGGELNSELHVGTGSVASKKGSVYAGRIASGEQPAQASSKIE